MILTRVVKLSYSISIILILIISTLFLGFKNVKADVEIPKIIINEVMANPEGSDTNREWFEIYNYGNSDIDLLGYQARIYNTNLALTKTINFSSTIIPASEYLIIINNSSNYKPCNACKYYNAGTFSITNSKGKIVLSKTDNSYNNDFYWDNDVGDGFSMEIIGPPYDDSYQLWVKSLDKDGTPCARNSISDLIKPQSPTLLSPFDTENTTERNILFQWKNIETGLNFEFILSQNVDMTDPIVDVPDIVEQKYIIDDLEIGKYYWKVIASNALYSSSSTVSLFTIVEQTYSENIMINELLANPTGDQNGEWIELFNNSDSDVNLKGWAIQDIKGSVHKYVFPSDFIIEGRKYVVIFRSQSGITLNDDADGLILYQPNGNILHQTSLFTSAGDDVSWARAPDNTWSWSTTPTPAAENKISFTNTTVPPSSGDDINQTPIEIQTGEIENYQNQLVKITGEVVDTSGNTFYLDDGSGEVKIYIQEKTGIDKPTMHKGDIFAIIGFVDLYNGIWRILPRYQDDVKLINSATSVTKKSIAKASTKKTAIEKEASSKNSITPKVKASTISNLTDKTAPTDKNTTPSFWMQFIKMISAFSLIALVYLIFRYKKYAKEKVVGGHFGEDET